ncbi:MAG: DNA replication and repair protein RecF [Alistipes sp.]|nr:DNA replication and repair protein RecF [Alistipes sp.]MBQ8437824.1 DNA replication and repair protein RecF [Alistipes sp.]
MRLKRLSLLNFKNLSQTDIALSEGINCFVGDNGAGKTNVLDAIYYLSMSKSAFTMTDGQSVRHGEEFFFTEGTYSTDGGGQEQVVCSFSRRTGKVLKRNGKEYDRVADHVGLFPVVIVSPRDTDLITDAAEERRRYLNGFISQLDRVYLNSIMRYNAVLTERNRFLKSSSDEAMLQIYDMQLAEHGTRVYNKRQEMVERLSPMVAEYYRTLSDDREQVEIEYRSELQDMPMQDILLRARERDIVNQFTTAGVHRDDLVFRIGGYPLRKYGSQGQQKSFLIALKLAQYRLLAEATGEKPILLLDDLFDKLDMGRVEQLLTIVSHDDFGQICITDCNKVRLESTLARAEKEYALFTVEGGDIGR